MKGDFISVLVYYTTIGLETKEIYESLSQITRNPTEIVTRYLPNINITSTPT
jgi:hypothetical protein